MACLQEVAIVGQLVDRITPVQQDAFFAIDGLLEGFLTVLNQMQVFEEAIDAENSVQLPFLATTTILMESVKAGSGREAAHLAIKENALAASREIREGRPADADLLGRLARDQRIPLSLAKLESIAAESSRFVGAAPKQVDQFKRDVFGRTA